MTTPLVVKSVKVPPVIADFDGSPGEELLLDRYAERPVRWSHPPSREQVRTELRGELGRAECLVVDRATYVTTGLRAGSCRLQSGTKSPSDRSSSC